MKSRREALLNILKNKNYSRFEKRVYRIVTLIRRGEVRSYKWVAEKIGTPKAYRAVGNALNKNPYPCIIPCHRVIKSDGAIGGYYKGAASKRRLLLSEGNSSEERKIC